MGSAAPAARARSAPSTIGSGPRSPPRASTATRTVIELRRRCAERLDLAPAVRPAVRADAMRPLRTVALRALVDPRRLEAVRRAALVAACLRGLLLRDSHGSPTIAALLAKRASMPSRSVAEVGAISALVRGICHVP